MRAPAAWMVAALALSSCNERGSEGPTAGAPPAVKTPVGTVPGPGVQPPLMANPYAGSAVSIRMGQQWFFRYNCAGCHGDHGGGGMGPSLRDKEWRYGASDAHIFDSIAEGRSFGMPAWGTKIPEEQIWQMVAFIQSFRTELEPSPPTPIPGPPQQPPLPTPPKQ